MYISPRFNTFLCVSEGCPGAVEVKLGKNRTEADVRRYSEERDRLEKEREEVRSSLASFKKERREAREDLNACQEGTHLLPRRITPPSTAAMHCFKALCTSFN